VLDALWLHREAEARRDGREPRTSLDAPGGITAPPQRLDVGQIAVVQDTGDLILAGNAIDLENVGLRFTRNGAGGYDVSRIDAAFRSSLGTRVALTDDDSAAFPVAFGFPYYGTTQTAAFVNSDGNITFEEEDRASTERNVARLLTGPPRVAPFLADLDPSTGNGRIYVNAAADQYTVTWCTVRGFESTSTITAQVTLLPDGSIEFKYERILIADVVVGVSPGRTGIFTPVNLSDQTSGGGAEAVGERFAARPQIDTVAMIRKFYQTHPDDYDQLVVWTDLPYVRDAFAYEQTVANEISGIGIPVFDLSREFGSGGRLRSMAIMDFIGKYPEDPTTRVPGIGENNTLSVLAGGRAPLARVRQLPGPVDGAALGPDPRPRSGALELLHGQRRVRDGRQRHRGPWRRIFQDGCRRAALQPSRPVPDGARSTECRAGVFLCR
jgi:hypothetical protein